MKVLLLVILGAALPFGALAAGIGVSAERIEIRAWDFFPARASFFLSNPNAYHAAFRVSAEGAGANWLSFSDRQLVLAPGQSQEVALKISARRGGEFDPEILIEEIALEGESLGIGSGVRLPVRIRSRAIWGPLAAATLILFSIVIIKIIKIKTT